MGESGGGGGGIMRVKCLIAKVQCKIVLLRFKGGGMGEGVGLVFDFSEINELRRVT